MLAQELLMDRGSGKRVRLGEAEQAAEWTERAIEARERLVAMLPLTLPYSPVLRSPAAGPRWRIE
jgi:hypothetical protein